MIINENLVFVLIGLLVVFVISLFVTDEDIKELL